MSFEYLTLYGLCVPSLLCSWPLGPSLLSPVILKIKIMLAAPALSINIYKYFLFIVCYDLPKFFVDFCLVVSLIYMILLIIHGKMLNPELTASQKRF